MLASLGMGRPSRSTIWILAWLGLLVSSRAGAAPSLRTTPSPLTLEGELRRVRLEARGIPGQGPARAAVNIGSLGEVSEEGGVTVLHLTTPAERFPQQLVLVLWRPGGGFHLLRAPMLGRTVVPIRTRRGSMVTVSVGGRTFGPLHSKLGRLSVPVLVLPGVSAARVKVVDSAGLENEKTITIATPAYNLLALAIDPETRTLAIGSADPSRGTPVLEVNGRPLTPRQLEPGLWTASVADLDSVKVRAWLPGQPLSTRELEAQLRAPAVAVRSEPAVTESPEVTTQRTASDRRWAGVVGVGVGFAHNIGALIAPRFTLSLGVELRLPVGWLGLRGLAGVSWGGHEAQLEAGQASSRVWLVPIGAALTYRLPFRVLTPYLAAGCLAQLVRTQNQLGLEERLRHDVALTVLALLGAERQLGPGLIFLESGYQWSRLENEDVELLAGGVLLEAGYRFRF